jgi:hypothetical protein
MPSSRLAVAVVIGAWMGCIFCPNSGAGGEEDRLSLLEKGERVRFYKLKNGDGEEARYSR